MDVKKDLTHGIQEAKSEPTLRLSAGLLAVLSCASKHFNHTVNGPDAGFVDILVARFLHQDRAKVDPSDYPGLPRCNCTQGELALDLYQIRKNNAREESSYLSR